MKETKHPRFAITMGDPAGIGPEIALKALSSPSVSPDGDLFVIGDFNVLQHNLNLVTGWNDLHEMASVDDFEQGCLNVLSMNRVTFKDLQTGKPSAACGAASYAYLTKGIDLCLENKIAGIITNPISTESFHLAGIAFRDQTQILSEKTGVRDFSMMYGVEDVYTMLVTSHVSVRLAIDLITRERVLKNVILFHKSLRCLGIAKPRIAVAGLNPHAGENGLFGDEEIRFISPAIEDAKKLGIEVTGPCPPDTVFMRAFRGEFDGVVSMLHDQGFGSLKSRNFEEGINITVGLPLVRTSVGHGTAFDIAGKGMASEVSLVGAIKAAEMLWKNREAKV
jgi:4-hydroxythreonine-4-phosphate dehydrogenase